MESVGTIVNVVLDEKGWRQRVLEKMAVELFHEVVGDPVNGHTIAERFSGGVLYVRARSPQWTHELHFLEARIIARINGRLRQPIVQKIKCNVVTPVGMLKSKIRSDYEDPTFPAAKKKNDLLKKVPVDDEAARKGRELAGEIEDEEMRNLMARVIAAVTRANEEKEAKPNDQ